MRYQHRQQRPERAAQDQPKIAHVERQAHRRREGEHAPHRSGRPGQGQQEGLRLHHSHRPRNSQGPVMVVNAHIHCPTIFFSHVVVDMFCDSLVNEVQFNTVGNSEDLLRDNQIETLPAVEEI